MKSMSEIFEKIYQDKLWVSSYENPSSLSGPGSFPELDGTYHIFLNDFLKKYKIKSIVDYGCGDASIYKGFNLDDYFYTGIDVSKTAIELAKKNYPNKTFICDETLDLPSADLLIVKDVFGHWAGDKHTIELGNKSYLIEDFLNKNYDKFLYILIIDGNQADFEKYFTKNMKFKFIFMSYGHRDTKKSSKKIYIKETI